MKKTLLPVLLILSVIFSFSACGSSKEIKLADLKTSENIFAFPDAEFGISSEELEKKYNTLTKEDYKEYNIVTYTLKDYYVFNGRNVNIDFLFEDDKLSIAKILIPVNMEDGHEVSSMLFDVKALIVKEFGESQGGSGVDFWTDRAGYIMLHSIRDTEENKFIVISIVNKKLV